MRSPTLRFQELLRRMGVEGGGQTLDIVPSVQPVVEVGDVAPLVPILAPPTSLVGGHKAGGGTVPTTPAFQFGATAGKALSVEMILGASGANAGYRCALSTLGSEILTLANTAVPTNFPIGGADLQTPARFTLTLGTADRGLLDLETNPRLIVINNGSIPVSLLIPAGEVFEVVNSSNGGVLELWAIVTEIEHA